MELQSERLLLKQHGLAYLESTHAYANDPENTTFMIHLPNKDIEETRAFLTAVEAEWAKAPPRFYEFAIVLKATKQSDQELHIGAVSVSQTEQAGEFELGWILQKDYWHQGLALEAARTVLDFTINELAASRVIAHCDAANHPSSQLMEKLGMQLISRSGGRRNKSATEDSDELLYALDI